MPTLRITVLDPPAAFPPGPEIELLLQTKDGFLAPIEVRDDALVFEAPFEMRPDRSGVVHPAGKTVHHHGDGRRFVYLAWLGDGQIFRRIKLYFGQLPDLTSEVTEVSIQGRDKKGEPACSTAKVVDSGSAA